MRMLFLRGAVPPNNEHPEKLHYGALYQCEDMWTHLFNELLKHNQATGELIYVGGNRIVDNGRMVERWLPKLAVHKIKYEPDLIFCRGGFDYYEPFISQPRFQHTYKVYYGAGKRFYPTGKFTDYDLFLVDTPKQKQKIERLGGRAELFIKPAAPLFVPSTATKQFDVCFMANATQAAIKGHKDLFIALRRTGLSILNIGNTSYAMKRLGERLGTDVTWGGWHLRRQLPKLISACRVGVCCSNSVDSCPRVIPEYLACDLPIVVANTVQFWREKYVTPATGCVTYMSQLAETVQDIIDNRTAYHPHQYYAQYLSVEQAAAHITELIKIPLLKAKSRN
jgi:glycosyltransferase involved in cell wall biosynthesis